MKICRKVENQLIGYNYFNLSDSSLYKCLPKKTYAAPAFYFSFLFLLLVVVALVTIIA